MQTLLPIASAKQMQEMDKACMSSSGISSIELMHQAAFAFYSKLVQDKIFENVSSLLILCGKGNNGGDGYCLAPLFAKMGIRVFVFSVEDEKAKSADTKHYYKLCKQNPSIEIFSSIENLKQILPSCDMLIDAVYGTQFRDVFTKKVEDLFRIISERSMKKVAVDIPSGLCADSATLCPYAFKADLTITFEFLKPALVSYPACSHAGRVEVVDIGFSREIKSTQTFANYIISDPLLTLREENTHKGNFGKLLLACGSKTMTGAGFFAAIGALRFGVGLLYYSCSKKIMPLMQMKINEAVFLPYSKKNSTSFLQVFENLNIYSAIVHGCGFGTSKKSQEVTKFLLKNASIPLILDADALTTISQNTDLLLSAKAPLILTPHEQEMARLTGTNSETVKNNRITYAKDFAKKFNCYLILKGARTIISCPDGEIFINSSGNAGMARGGSGDILAGMIGAAIANIYKKESAKESYHTSIKKALCSAVYNHGLAGDKCAKVKGQRAMTPTDMLEYIS